MTSSDFQGKRESITHLVGAVRMLNVVTAAIQMLAGAGSLTSLLYLDVPAALVALYVMLFALLLLLFECRFRFTDAFLRKYFGFLYTYRGLGGYLLMMGILDLGMAGGIFGIVAGCAACFTALIVFFVGCCAPRISMQHDETINNAYVPSYGSSSRKASTLSGHLPVVAIPIATPVPSSSSSSKKSKKKQKNSSSLLNTTLNP